MNACAGPKVVLFLYNNLGLHSMRTAIFLVGTSCFILGCASNGVSLQAEATEQALRWYQADIVCRKADVPAGAGNAGCVQAFIQANSMPNAPHSPGGPTQDSIAAAR